MRVWIAGALVQVKENVFGVVHLDCAALKTLDGQISMADVTVLLEVQQGTSVLCHVCYFYVLSLIIYLI